jgi:hypothetical protein
VGLLLAAGAGAPAEYTLDAEVGSFALTGNTAALTEGRAMLATVGAFALTGTTTGLAHAHQLPVTVGAFTFTAQDAGLTVAHSLQCETGSFQLTGIDAELSTTATVVEAPVLQGGAFSWARPRYWWELERKRRKKVEDEEEQLIVYKAPVIKAPEPVPFHDIFLDLQRAELLALIDWGAEFKKPTKRETRIHLAKQVLQLEKRMHRAKIVSVLLDHV